MRRLPALLLVLLAAPGLRADPAQTPFLVLREPDPATDKLIRDLVTEKSLGGGDRRQKREELARIGPWCVPYLVTALKKENARIKLNAVLTLAMIRDPRCLPALREAAEKDESLWVRRAATLAIPLFEWGQDLETLKKLVDPGRGEWRSVAPAVARLHAKQDAADLLVAAAKHLPRDEHDAAAILLSGAIARADIPFADYLEDRSKLVQEAAAAGLAVRPLLPQRAGKIIDALKRSRMGHDARVLAIRALGAIDPRPDDAQAELLDIASKDGDADERIAALLELRGTGDEIGPLWKAYQRLRDRNDPVVAALLLALARTREPKARDKLLDLVTGGSDYVRFYAGAALLYVYAPGNLEDYSQNYRDHIAQVEKLRALAQGFASSDEAKRRSALVDLKRHRDLGDKLKLLYFDRGERNWLEVNRVLTKIFELGTALKQFDATGPGRTPESALDGGGGDETTKKAATASDEQQDLFDFLMPPNPDRRAYFGPEDLRRG